MRRTPLAIVLLLLALVGVGFTIRQRGGPPPETDRPGRSEDAAVAAASRSHAAPARAATPVPEALERRVEGSVEDEDDEAIDGASVTLHRLRDPPVGTTVVDAPQLDLAHPLATVQTDADGEFEITTTEPGELAIAVRKEGFALGTDEVEDDFAFVTLHPAATHHVLVTDEDDVPVANAQIAVSSSGWRPSYAVATTDSGGRAHFVADASPTLRISAAGFVTITEHTDEESTPESPIWIELEEGRQISGIVTDERSGPLAGVRVTLHSSYDSSGAAVVTGDDGAFSFGGLSASTGTWTWSVRPERDGYCGDWEVVRP